MQPLHIEPIALSQESTVVAEFQPKKRRDTGYQSEAQLEKKFIRQLESQAYVYLDIKSEESLIINLRHQLEKLNKITFSDKEWRNFFKASISGDNDGIIEKTQRIHDDYIQVLTRDDGSTENIRLIDKKNIHNNSLQVINQYESHGHHLNRYDVTILVNGLPMVHIELKRRGVSLHEAFNQIKRYRRDSFWAGSGLCRFHQFRFCRVICCEVLSFSYFLRRFSHQKEAVPVHFSDRY